MSTAWLKDLEERVHQATERLGALGEQKAKLEKKVTGLEARIAELETELADAATTEPAAWTEERDDIRSRVAALVEHLDRLLENGATLPVP